MSRCHCGSTKAFGICSLLWGCAAGYAAFLLLVRLFV